ncbi:MAG: proton-conducting transporter membrane subunit [Candidatus Altiarchaeia archaeon]
MFTPLFYLGLVLSLLGFVLPLMRLEDRGNASRRLSYILSITSSISFLAFSILSFGEKGASIISLYSNGGLIDFSFYIDRLSAFFIAVISIVSLSSAVYSIDYGEHIDHVRRKNYLASLLNLFALSMVLAVASYNTLAFIFFWEILSMSSFVFVLFEYEKPGTRKAALYYFIMTQMSTVFLMLGFFGIYANTCADACSFVIRPLTSVSQNLSLIFLSLFIGFSIKAGVVPFHKWLPYAHPAAPSGISAMMSGVMIKVAIYGLIRFTYTVLPKEDWWGILILVAGTLSAILGVIYALKEHDIKRLLAYHSIENIGIILIGFGLYLIYSANNLPALATLAFAAALFHTLNHALFKSLLFLTAGSVVSATGQRNIEEYGGLIKAMPYTAFLFLVGAVSISGLPPFNGFVSELMIFQAFFGSYLIQDPLVKSLLVVCLSVFALTSALAAACFVKAFGITFLAVPRSESARNAKEAGKYMIAGACIPAALCMGLGVFSLQIFSFIGYRTDLPDMLFMGILLTGIYAAAYVILKQTSADRESAGETWGCGMTHLSARTEYTASGFSQPIVRFFKDVYQTNEESKRTFYDRQNTLFKEGSGEIHLIKFFEEKLYNPVSGIINRISIKVSALENWNLDSYVLYAFIAVLLTVAYVGWIA